ncbi:MAG: hypothetical protein FD123_3519 [Bacteroidetes bacterium]|nr:MAG: hypothetical protein FD123_3519 [Bacteroidota bacterium]
MKNKINYDRQKPSSEEINAGKNFDGLLQQFQAAGGAGAAAGASKIKPLWKKGWFAGTLATAAALAVGLTLYFNQNEVSGTGSKGPGVTDNNSNNTTTRQPEFANSVQAPSACIAPPLAGLDIPYNTFKVKGDKGSKIQYSSGSRINIPAHAFVDEKGNPVNGEVDVRYRELRDPVDFFLSGIPMAYDSAGQKYHFESAGMIDIAAFKDGKVVYMNPSKKVEIQLASDNASTAFNLYQLDTAKHNWTYLGKDKVTTEKAGDPKVEAEVKLAAKKNETDQNIKQLETDRDQKVAQVESQIPFPAGMPQPPRKVNKKKNRFDLDMNYTEFPEMQTYKGVVWEVDENSKKFNREVYDIEWEDVKLMRGEVKDSYQMVVKKGLRTEKIDVYPVFEGVEYEKAIADFSKKYTQYTTTLNNRKAEEDRLRKEYEEQMRGQRLAYQKYQDEIKQQLSSLTMTDKVFRTFQILNFGVFNCDSPMMYPKGADVMATFTDESGKQLFCQTKLYLVDKARNGLFTYYANPEKSFRFNPSASNIIWTVSNGKLHTLMPDEFAKIGTSGRQQVKLNAVAKEFESPEEMRAYFGI